MSKKKFKVVTQPTSMEFKYLDPKVIYAVMSIPTMSFNERIMAYYINMWAEKNGVNFEIDNIGNIMLTKGEVEEGEFYPCLTAHQDTVQCMTSVHIAKGEMIKMAIKRKADGTHHLFAKEGFGIGADCKAGIAIALSLFNKFEKLKAFFPVAEEIGCLGTDYFFNSKNKSFFDNVGYVLGFDSPEFNRAAWASNGVKLFTKEWFNEYLKDVADENGVTTFRFEPYTDVYMIRKNTKLVCMNMGNGGYKAHTCQEYLNLEECDKACKFGEDIINKLGNTQHINESLELSDKNDSDMEFFTKYFKKYGVISKEDDMDSELEGTMNVNDFNTMKTKLLLRLQVMGVDVNEIACCFDWSCGNWDKFIDKRIMGDDAIVEDKDVVEEVDTTDETIDKIFKEEEMATVATKS